MQVAPTPQQGMAITIDDSSGLVEFTQDQPYVMETRDDKERIPFDPREVPPCRPVLAQGLGLCFDFGRSLACSMKATDRLPIG